MRTSGIAANVIRQGTGRHVQHATLYRFIRGLHRATLLRPATQHTYGQKPIKG